MKKVCRCFASFSSEQDQFTHGHVHDSPYSFFRSKKNEPIMFYERINTKVFRRSIAFAIAVVDVNLVPTFFKQSLYVHCVRSYRDTGYMVTLKDFDY